MFLCDKFPLIWFVFSFLFIFDKIITLSADINVVLSSLLRLELNSTP
jgi:hypothetical protein